MLALRPENTPVTTLHSSPVSCFIVFAKALYFLRYFWPVFVELLTANNVRSHIQLFCCLAAECVLLRVQCIWATFIAHLAYLRRLQLAERCILVPFLCWLSVTLFRNLNLEACFLHLIFSIFAVLLKDCYLL